MATGSRATILVVDDEKMVREVVGAILGRSGHRVILASTGWDALSICREHEGPIDMAILDVVMPGMSGVEVRNFLLELIPNVPVLYMSGFGYSEIGKYGISAVEENFIHKPFTVMTLCEKVDAILKRPRMARTA